MNKLVIKSIGVYRPIILCVQWMSLHLDRTEKRSKVNILQYIISVVAAADLFLIIDHSLIISILHHQFIICSLLLQGYRSFYQHLVNLHP